jgi:hypothetical protein
VGECIIAASKPGSDQMKFFCSQVLMDLDELIDEWPLGEIETVVMGFGANYGAAILISDNPIAEVLFAIDAMDDIGLALLGLCRSHDQVVRVAFNGRPINKGDAEHDLCKLYEHIEHEPGGTRAISLNPKSIKSHCHPVKNITFKDIGPIADNAFKAFNKLVDEDQWMTYALTLRPAADADSIALAVP